MLSSKSYLFRALYDWIVDNNCTPHMVVDAMLPDVQVPQQFVKDGQIVLNISPGAVVGFSIDRQSVDFNARFGGVPLNVHVPMYAVTGIYARENGRGMMFDPEELPDPEHPQPEHSNKKSGSGKPVLRVVK